MKFINSEKLMSVRGSLRAGVAAGVCCGFLALPSPVHAQDEDIADQIENQLRSTIGEGANEEQRRENDPPEASDDQFRARVEDALNDRPSAPEARNDQRSAPEQDLGQPYYRDARGRFFFLDPAGGRVYVDQQREQRQADRQTRPQPPRMRQASQGPQLGVLVTDSPEGIRVDQVQGASVAAEAGIQPGDVLQQFNGQPVNDPRQLQQLVQSMAAGQAAELSVLRNGAEQTLTATFPGAEDGEPYGAAKPAVDGSDLQQEVEQLRSEVESLRQQMNRLHNQELNDSEDREERRPSPPQPFEQEADQDTSRRATATENDEPQAEAAQSDEEAEAVRAKSNEKIDLSTDEGDAEAELEAETSEPEPSDDNSSSL